MQPAPRHFVNALPHALLRSIPGCGMPQERLARIAARRSFVAMKQQFMSAVDGLDGSRGDWLRHQVRHACDPVDLWLLRGAVFDALSPSDEDSQRMRLDLHRALDSVFADQAEREPRFSFGTL